MVKESLFCFFSLVDEPNDTMLLARCWEDEVRGVTNAGAMPSSVGRPCSKYAALMGTGTAAAAGKLVGPLPLEGGGCHVTRCKVASSRVMNSSSF